MFISCRYCTFRRSQLDWVQLQLWHWNCCSVCMFQCLVACPVAQNISIWGESDNLFGLCKEPNVLPSRKDWLILWAGVLFLPATVQLENHKQMVVGKHALYRALVEEHQQFLCEMIVSDYSQKVQPLRCLLDVDTPRQVFTPRNQKPETSTHLQSLMKEGRMVIFFLFKSLIRFLVFAVFKVMLFPEHHNSRWSMVLQGLILWSPVCLGGWC